MDVRTRTEEIERLTLAPWATFSDESRGRQRPEEQDPIRPVFQRDRDRVLHCKAFRRSSRKRRSSSRRRRPLPHPPDPHAGSLSDRPHHRPGAAAQRGPDRGHQPRPRPWPHPLRPRRRAGAGSAHARRLQALYAEPAGGGQAREGRAGPQPDLGGAQRHRHPHKRQMGRDARGPHRADGRPDRLRQPRHRGRRPGRCAGPGHPAEGLHRRAGPDEVRPHHHHDKQHPRPQRRGCGSRRGGE